MPAAQSYNGLSKGLMATFIFTASERFDRAVAEPGDNLTNLLQGLGNKKGLGRLFAQLSTLAWAVAASQARAWHPGDVCMLAYASCRAHRLLLLPSSGAFGLYPEYKCAGMIQGFSSLLTCPRC